LLRFRIVLRNADARDVILTEDFLCASFETHLEIIHFARKKDCVFFGSADDFHVSVYGRRVGVVSR